MKKEQWIHEVMSSLEGLEKAEGNPYLHTRIMAKTEQPEPVSSKGWKPVYILSSVAGLILFLNILNWFNTDNVNTTDTVIITTNVTDYELGTSDY